MPIVIPTPDEIARMDARQRAAWRKRMGVVLSEANQSRLMLEFGEMARKQAEVWHRICGVDPDADLHRQQLAEAIR
jgi:hypothetical protein